MKIIVIMNEKGGVGKSTIATNLATSLLRSGFKVVLVDSDSQGTARDWRAARPEGVSLPTVVALDRAQLLGDVRTLDADYVIIDSPAKAASIAAAAVRVADIALVVIQPSGADLWASAATVKLLNAKLDAGGKIDCAFLLNRVSPGTKLAREVQQGDWNEYGIEQLSSVVGNRTAFAQALTDGISVYELDNAAAKADIENIVTELKEAKWL